MGVDDETRTRTRTSEDVPRDSVVDERARIPGVATVPTAIGRYRVTGYLGRGGMGMVLSAEDTELKRSVALKLLHAAALGEKASKRVEREAQAMAKLSHPNVVTVYEVGRVGDQPFIAMELVTGSTARDWLREESRSWRSTLAMLIAAGRGLAAAHDAGLVHRDFKPENVLVGSDGRPRVTDFGLVATDLASSDSGGGGEAYSTIGGTPAYMPPEQWSGREIDARADQYAFAVTCWEALWGQKPFAPGIASDAAQRGPARVRERRGVPRRIEAALRRALQADRELRWPSLSILLDRLDVLRRDSRRIFAAAAFAMVAVGAAALMYARSTGADDLTSVCRRAGDDVDGILSVERQRMLAAAFAKRPEPFAADAWTDVQRSVESWRADYRGLRIQTCQVRRTGGVGAGDLVAARDSCLDRRRAELAALLEGLALPDATTVRYARSAARGLTRPVACLGTQTDGVRAAKAPLSAHDSLSSARKSLVEASTQRALGKPLEAVRAAAAAAKAAEGVGWAPLIAESQLELGLAYQAANLNEDGEKAHQVAVLAADAAQDDETRFAATLGLADAAMDHSEYDEAGRAIERARMIARRLPPDERREVSIAVQESLLGFWRGEYDRCIEVSKATIDKIARVLGPTAIEGVVVREKLAHCLSKQEKVAEAEAVAREALAIADASIGREHPIAADILFNLAYQIVSQGKTDEALALLQEALGIRERALGPNNPIVGLSHAGLGDFLLSVGRPREARPHLARAAEIIEPSWGSDSPALAIAERLLGEAAAELGESDEAERHYRRALAIYLVKRPPGHDEISHTQAELGRVLVDKGDRDGLPLLEAAVDAYARSPGVRPAAAAFARLNLARALLSFGDRARGRTMFKDACVVLLADPNRFPRETQTCRELRFGERGRSQ